MTTRSAMPRMLARNRQRLHAIWRLRRRRNNRRRKLRAAAAQPAVQPRGNRPRRQLAHRAHILLRRARHQARNSRASSRGCNRINSNRRNSRSKAARRFCAVPKLSCRTSMYHAPPPSPRRRGHRPVDCATSLWRPLREDHGEETLTNQPSAPAFRHLSAAARPSSSSRSCAH